MLDQNTDRMWYVIGAVIIGAAIILILNGTVPQLFASVGDSFTTAADKAIHSLETLEDVEYALYTTGDVDLSNYPRTGEIIIDKGVGVDSSVHLKVNDLDLSPNTTYILTYSFQKIDGEMWGIGGHTDIAYNNNVYYVDGQRMRDTYRSRPAWSAEMSELVNQGGIHEVTVRFTTPDQLIADEQTYDQYDGRIYIQPNRMDDSMAVRVRITDLNMQEVIE